MKKASDLKILPVNKTVVFTSPLEGDDVLVRTGTIKEGSCFFHAILHAYSKEYTFMSKSDRMKYIRRIRASMSGKIDKETWEEMAGGVIAKVPFLEMVHKILLNFDLFLSESNDKIRGRATRKTIKLLVTNDSELEVYKIISSLVPVQTLVNKVLPDIYKKSNTLKIKDTINLMIEDSSSYFTDLEEIKAVDNNKKEYLLNIFKIYLKVVCNEAYKETYKNYIKELENTKEDINSYSIQFISERFDRDLYFINGNNRLPYNECPDHCNISGKKAIILLKVNDNHYEILGRLLPGNKIQREFDFNDHLVKKINMFLNEPRKIKHHYPELNDFLPKSPTRQSLHKEIKQNNQEDNEEENISDNESDLYYDSSGISGSDSDSDSDE